MKIGLPATKKFKKKRRPNKQNWMLLPFIFPTVIIWNLKKDKTKDLSNHYRAVITMQLCILGITLVGLWLYWKVNETTPFIGGLLAGGLVAIMNAINVINGRPYINPFIKSEDKN